MPSFQKRITKAVIDDLKPGETIWDTRLTGFGARCQRRDKMFVFKTRIAGRQRWFTVGKFGNPWTVETAKEQVKVIQGDIAKGVDAAGLRDEQLRNPTLAEAAKVFLEMVISKRSAATQTQYRDFLERLVYPKIGKARVAEIKHSDIARLHYELRGRKVTANREVAVLSSFFSWCERHGHRPKLSNPTHGVEKYEEKGRERFLSPRELARLGIALSRAERNGTETVFALAAIRLLIFTGCRRDEILKLRWNDVDLDRTMIRLPDSKTGPRTVYLSAPAISVLASLPRIAKNPFVIVGDRDQQHLVNLRKAWVRVCKVARLKGVRLHDLRHSFASVGVSGGASLPIIGRLLGHSKAATTEKYSHLAADPVRAANEAVGNQIEAMMRGRKGEIVQLKARGIGG
jgi:integrase